MSHRELGISSKFCLTIWNRRRNQSRLDIRTWQSNCLARSLCRTVGIILTKNMSNSLDQSKFHKFCLIDQNKSCLGIDTPINPSSQGLAHN